VNDFKRWGWAGLAALGMALAGCGGGGDSSSSVSLRVANATLTHPSLDLYLNGGASVTAIASDTVSDYATPSSGSNTVQLNDNGSGTSLISSIRTLNGGAHYTMVAYESGGSVKTFVMSEDTAAPASGATLRIFDAAIEAGKIDVYITTSACTNLSAISPALSFGTLTAPTPLSVNQGAGTYNVCVTGTGSKTDLRLSMPITLTSQEVATVVLTPASSGGLLVNGALVVQQSTYTAARNTNVRVRLAAGLSGSVPVAAVATDTSGTFPIDSGNAPLFGYVYKLVPASSALAITVNSASIAAPSQALVPGSDMTLLVNESGSGPVATLLTDDNRLPSDPTTVKLRLINGTNNGTGPVTLTANNSPIGVDIATGAASDYTTVPGASNAAFTLMLTSSTAGTFSTATTLNPNTVYNVLAVGSFPTPQLLIR
jgi:hypothetical protein